jgi:hypothetical protein
MKGHVSNAIKIKSMDVTIESASRPPVWVLED